MAAFSWEASYSLNIESMDRQHQKILALMEGVTTGMAEKNGKRLLDEMLDTLELHCKAHFFEEERLMEKKDFPSTTEHKRQHDRFMEELGRFRPEKNPDTFLAINTWFINHILTEDMRYSEFFLIKR